MGFTSGLTGGIVVTLGIAYMSIRAHQRSRDAQRQTIRSQAYLLHQAVPVESFPLHLRADSDFTGRPGLVEVVKSRWNAEISSAVHWVLQQDWEEARERAEDSIAGLWTKLAGSTAGDAVAAASASADTLARDVASAAHAAAERASGSVSSVIDPSVGSAQHSGRDAPPTLRERATRSFAAVASIPESTTGNRRVADGTTPAVSAQGSSRRSTEQSAVDHALRQRFEGGPKPVLTTEEALRDRYRPLEERDSTQLRGL